MDEVRRDPKKIPQNETSIDEVVERRKKWKEARAESYSYEYDAYGFFAGPSHGPVRIEVTGTTVTSAAYIEEAPAPDSQKPSGPTIDGLFDWIERELEGDDVERVLADYSEGFGFPTAVRFESISENWSFEAVNYQPR